jgi:hypothetical protein
MQYDTRKIATYSKQQDSSFFTLNFVPTVWFVESDNISGFCDLPRILVENNFSNWQSHDDKRLIRSAGNGSLFFSKKPFVS